MLRSFIEECWLVDATVPAVGAPGCTEALTTWKFGQVFNDLVVFSRSRSPPQSTGGALQVLALASQSPLHGSS